MNVPTITLKLCDDKNAIKVTVEGAERASFTQGKSSAGQTELLAEANCCSIQVAEFQGTDKTSLLRRNEYGHLYLPAAIKQVLDDMEAWSLGSAGAGERAEGSAARFDFSCFREAWLNACLYNCWERQIPPAVYIFDDRIEIVSAGGLPKSLTLEEFYEGKSCPVNFELQKLMAQLGYIEQTGHGVPLIVSRYGKEAFNITENYITVTIPLDHSEYVDDSEYSFHICGQEKPVRESRQNVHEQIIKESLPDKEQEVKKDSPPAHRKKEAAWLSDSDRKIMALMKENGKIKVSEISEQIGLGLTTVTKRVRMLREAGLIERKGSKKVGVWVVKNS